MDGAQLLVTVIGIAAILWVNWFFFMAGRRTAVVAVATGSGIQEIPIVVNGGYAPATVSIRPGRPVRLLFDRRDQGNCTEEVVLPDFGLRRFLPTGAITPVEFTPERPGTYEFTCGMGMVRGKLIVEER